MIGICDVSVQAANPNMPLHPLRAFVNSPSSLRIRNVPKRIGDWNISSVQLVVAYPDNTVKTVECKLIGNVWVGTVAGSNITGRCENGYTVFASGNDENGNPVSNYALGKGLVEILEADADIKPGADIKYVRIFDEEPETPKDGDVWQISGAWYIYQDNQAWPIGDDSGLIGQLSSELSNYATHDYVSAAIPTSLSSFNNDVGYITSAQVEPAGLANPQWAMKALYTATVLNRKTVFSAPDMLAGLRIIDSVPLVQFTSYYPWTLTYWNGTQFATPVEIGNFGYYNGIGVPFGPGGATITVQIKSYCWMSNDKVYFIKANDVDGIFQPVQFGVRNNISITWYNITLSLDEKSIASVEGITGLTECTRPGIYDTTSRNIAYDDDLNALSGALSAYATTFDVESELSAKQDALTQKQLGVIDELTYTTVKYSDQSIQTIVNSPDNTGWLYKWDIPNKADAVEIKIGYGITNIGGDALSGCTSLTSVTIPDSVTKIHDRAFYNCTSLSSVTIPASLTSFGNYTFWDCSNLKEVVFEGKPQLPGQTFYQCPNLTKIIFKNRLSSDIPSGKPWSATNAVIETWNAASQEWVMNMLSTWWAEHTS